MRFQNRHPLSILFFPGLGLGLIGLWSIFSIRPGILANNTEAWITLGSDAYGYSMQAPSSWFVNEGEAQNPALPESVTPLWFTYIYSGDPNRVRQPIAFSKGEVSFTLTVLQPKRAITNFNELTAFVPEGRTSTLIKFGSIDAIKYIEDRSSSPVETARLYSELILITQNDYIYQIDATSKDQASLEAHRTFIDEMIGKIKIF